MIHRTDTDTVCRELLNNNVLILYFVLRLTFWCGEKFFNNTISA